MKLLSSSQAAFEFLWIVGEWCQRMSKENSGLVRWLFKQSLLENLWKPWLICLNHAVKGVPVLQSMSRHRSPMENPVFLHGTVPYPERTYSRVKSGGTTKEKKHLKTSKLTSVCFWQLRQTVNYSEFGGTDGRFIGRGRKIGGTALKQVEPPAQRSRS